MPPDPDESGKISADQQQTQDSQANANANLSSVSTNPLLATSSESAPAPVAQVAAPPALEDLSLKTAVDAGGRSELFVVGDYLIVQERVNGKMVHYYHKPASGVGDKSANKALFDNFLADNRRDWTHWQAADDKFGALRDAKVKSLGEYTVEGGYEIFYRTISVDHWAKLQTSNTLPGTTETTTSPTASFSDSYDGVMVKFYLKAGTINELYQIGIADDAKATCAKMGRMPVAANPLVQKPWKNKYARFKTEGSQVNIALGVGDALRIFNSNLVRFEKIRDSK